MIEYFGVKYITEKEASQKYGFSRSWFQKKRMKKEPPAFSKIDNGKVLYSINEIDEWFKSKLNSNK